VPSTRSFVRRWPFDLSNIQKRITPI
jgi:hypothetical protein